jgi:kumamolisin
MTLPNRWSSARRALSLGFTAALAAATVGVQNGALSDDKTTQTLKGHLTPLLASARPVARVAANDTIHLALTLPLHNEAALTDLLTHLYTPGDPQQGDFLTSQTFASRFGPSEADYAAVAAYANANGLTVDRTYVNRMVMDVSGPTASVEKAFGTRLFYYQTPDQRVFRSPEADPVVPTAIASRLKAIVGLDTAATWHTNYRVKAAPAANGLGFHAGTGPLGGLAPSDIKTAYNISATGPNGAGQTLGLFELDGYRATDITTYETQFHLPAVILQNVLVDGATGGVGSGAVEVTLDIELMIALAPGATKILVYEGPNSAQGVIDTYNRIATDNTAKQVSTSWGLNEASSGTSTLNSENTIFMQMAAQGQSIFAAAGDNGANDNGRSLSVDDPASQPFVTGAGGTTLTTTGAGGPYASEKTWLDGGGGISSVWPLPSYQSGVVSAASKGSTTKRNVPDVSLDADPNTGYAIYFGGWGQYGGTSCAAPLWAAFTALVNQQRVAAGSGVVGFLNPLIYTIGAGTRYSTDFHDIADSSTNGFYPAVTGYDDATGWGSFNGAGLLADLVAGTSGTGTGGGGTPPPPSPTQLLGNPGFENGTNAAPWVATAAVIDNSAGEAPHGGAWKAWLDGYGRTHIDTLFQQVAVPSTITQATLTFWLHIDTAETARTANDTLLVQVRNASGTVLATLATYSNLNAATGYSQKSFDLSAYKGQTIRVYLVGTENSTRATSFVVDDFALNVQ